MFLGSMARCYGPRLVDVVGVRQIHFRTMSCWPIHYHTNLMGILPSLCPGVSVYTIRCRILVVAFVVQVPGVLSIHRLLHMRMALFLQDRLFLLFLSLCPLGLFPLPVA